MLIFFKKSRIIDTIYDIVRLTLQDFRDRGWELIETGFCSILRKPASDILTEDQVYMSKGLRWEVMRSRLRSCTATFLGGLVVCMSLFKEELSMSFFVIFLLYALLISYLIYGYFRLKSKYRVDGR